MIAFEVYVNKVRVCTAGIDEFESIISSLVCSVNQDGRPDEPKIMFHVSGLSNKEAFIWKHYDLKLRDRVEIRIVDSSKVDKPRKVECPGGSCGI